MATNKKLQLSGTDIFPRAALDNIVLNATNSAGSTTLIASGGKIKPDYLASATGTTAGVVYNNDTDRLTITNGGISINAYTSNLSSATTAANKKKVPNVSGVQLFVSSYTSNYVKSAGVIPQSAVSGLADALSSAGGITSLTGTAGVEITNGNTVGLAAYQDILDKGTSATMTVEPGSAYRFNAVGTTSHTISCGTVPADKYGRDAHIQLMVGSAALVHFADPIVLMNPLTPFAAHDLVIKFRDGMAQAYVEDINAGYTVDTTSGTGSNTSHTGTLNYGLVTSAIQFITFDEEYAEYQTGAATLQSNKYLHGEGIGDTVLSATGTIATGSFALTVYSLSLGNVTFTGNLVMHECEIQGGAVVSGGSITFGGSNTLNGTAKGVLVMQNGAVVNGNGTLNMGSRHILLNYNSSVSFGGINVTSGFTNTSAFGGFMYLTSASASFSGTTIAGNNGSTGGGVVTLAGGTASFTGCIVSGNSSVNDGGALYCGNGGKMFITSSVITGNTCGAGKRGAGIFVPNTNATVVLTGTTVTGNNPSASHDIYLLNTGIASATACVLGDCYTSAGSYCFAGINTVDKLTGAAGKVVISSGASINLASSINPGGTGGITVLDGGCVVNGAAITGGTYSTITSSGGSAVAS